MPKNSAPPPPGSPFDAALKAVAAMTPAKSRGQFQVELRESTEQLAVLLLRLIELGGLASNEKQRQKMMEAVATLTGGTIQLASLRYNRL